MVLNDILKEKNIAEKLTEEQLAKIGKEVIQGFDLDEESRSDWKKAVKEYVKLALQVTEDKSFPWPNASNVKYPLIATAALQFNARAYPSLVPASGKIVSVGSYGMDEQNKKTDRSRRVSTYMSYQLTQEMDGWEDGMDNLLSILPIFGLAIKKTYFDPSKKTNQSVLVHPFNFVVNYWTTDLGTAPRVSEVLYRSKRELIEKQRKGIYLDFELERAEVVENLKEEINVSKNPKPTGAVDEQFTPYTLIEQHTYLDLDDDGYVEPYIVLVDHNSQKVLQIPSSFVDGFLLLVGYSVYVW